MTTQEAITILIDVVTGRKPHDRGSIKLALATLEPPIAKEVPIVDSK